MVHCLDPLCLLSIRKKYRGKHHPADVRMKYAARDREFTNQTAVLPIVTVRHPVPWLSALCRHGYSLHWNHDPDMCDSTLGLGEVVRARFGYTNESVAFNSLVDVWKDWNLKYLNERGYPLLMIRLEDIVYRPKRVVKEVCDCIGGELYADKPFNVFTTSMNDGKGHGSHRSSGLLSTFVKFGIPLEEWNTKFSIEDWKVMGEVLGADNAIVPAFGYRMPYLQVQKKGQQLSSSAMPR